MVGEGALGEVVNRLGAQTTLFQWNRVGYVIEKRAMGMGGVRCVRIRMAERSPIESCVLVRMTVESSIESVQEEALGVRGRLSG